MGFGGSPQQPPQTLQDSLQVVSGGARVTESDALLKLLGFLRGSSSPWKGAAFPYVNQILMQRNFDDPELGRHVLEHEFGHVTDFRNTTGPVEDAIKTFYGDKGYNENEAFADLFALAVEGLQQGDSEERIQNQLTNPLAMDEAAAHIAMLTGWLLQQNLYKDHPMNKKDK